jgi:hypothetical protein
MAAVNLSPVQVKPDPHLRTLYADIPPTMYVGVNQA